jgi:hypothetical protein
MGFLTKMDYLMYLKIRQWAKRVKGTTGSIKGFSYFRTVGRHNDRWTFSVLKGPTLLRHFKFTKGPASTRIVKTRGSIMPAVMPAVKPPVKPPISESPYSGMPAINEKYWSKRLRLLVKPSINTRVKLLLSKQKSICTWCKRRIFNPLG